MKKRAKSEFPHDVGRVMLLARLAMLVALLMLQFCPSQLPAAQTRAVVLRYHP
jgi:hypothetical protein